MATTAASMTAEEFLALPDDGVERWLVKGVVRTFGGGEPMSYRNRFHSRAMARVTRFLDEWLDGQPEPRGQVLTGDVGVRLPDDPDTLVGVDVAVVSAEVMAAQTGPSTVIDGVPTLAVELLSPSDTVDEVNDKIDLYLAAGVAVVWIVDPRRRTVTAYRPTAGPELFAPPAVLAGGPELPGFRVEVDRLFG